MDNPKKKEEVKVVDKTEAEEKKRGGKTLKRVDSGTAKKEPKPVDESVEAEELEAGVGEEEIVEEAVLEDVVGEGIGIGAKLVAEDKLAEVVENKLKPHLREILEEAGGIISTGREEYDHAAVWKPQTKLGERIKKGEIKSIKELIELGVPIKEVEIMDLFLPELQEEVLSVGRVQRVTDSGRRMRFRIVAAVGNGNGYIGIAQAKGKEAGHTIRKAIERAKLNIKEIKRGCGSWECGCGNPHTVPFKVQGKSGSVTVILKPAPRGLGLAAGETAKKILTLAGIKDAWTHTEGHTRTELNFAYAVYNALVNTNRFKIEESGENKSIVSGSV